MILLNTESHGFKICLKKMERKGKEKYAKYTSERKDEGRIKQNDESSQGRAVAGAG